MSITTDSSMMDAINRFLNTRIEGVVPRPARYLQDVERRSQCHSLMPGSCYVEFVPAATRAKFPACLTKDYGSFIGSSVILQDREQNRIQISIERKKCNIYFAKGWSTIGEFYGINSGGWLLVLFVNPRFFYIKVLDRAGTQITYPRRTPPHSMMLPEEVEGHSSTLIDPFIVPPNSFYHVLEKTLSAHDVDSGVLTLCWSGFCEQALHETNSEIILVDWLGHRWRCELRLTDTLPKSCQISGQWLDICKAHSFTKNLTVKFGATEICGNKIVHFRITPAIAVRTSLMAPTTSSTYKIFYQTENYFML